MNNYGVETRRRSRSLLIVEGKHEKDELFWLVFKCFPELNIDINDVWIYGTNIYKLYEDIVREYGNDWAKDRIDVDLPFVISKKEHMETVYYRNDFTNIILVFDYERHDPAFSEEKILEMQHCFEDSTDMGKLYLNYPMIESYLHLKSMPDGEYINRKIPVSLQPGDRYKCLVKSESVLGKFIELPHRIDKLSNTVTEIFSAQIPGVKIFIYSPAAAIQFLQQILKCCGQSVSIRLSLPAQREKSVRR